MDKHTTRVLVHKSIFSSLLPLRTALSNTRRLLFYLNSASRVPSACTLLSRDMDSFETAEEALPKLARAFKRWSPKTHSSQPSSRLVVLLCFPLLLVSQTCEGTTTSLPPMAVSPLAKSQGDLVIG